MRSMSGLGAAAAALAVAALAGCGTPSTTVPVGSNSDPPSPPTVPCGTTPPGVQPTTTTGAVPPATTNTNETPPITSVCGKEDAPSTTKPPSTVPSSTTSTIAIPDTTTSTTSAGRAACAPSLTLKPDSGPIGTVVTETAKCFPPNTTVTFTVPQSGGYGYRTDQSDLSGTVTQQFTYDSANGLVGSSTYQLNASSDRNVGVDDRGCPSSSCATAIFYER